MSAIESAAELVHGCYAAAVAAVQPAAALRAPLRATAHDGSSGWLISIGKAAPGMAAAIADWLAENGGVLAGGVVIGPHPEPGALVTSPAPSMLTRAPSNPALRFVSGDHPIPGDGSSHAAAAIDEVVRQIPATAEVHVAISGGASALIAGPLAGLTMADVTSTFEVLLTSGLDIHEMNAIRKRVTRWSAGRLALALAGRRVHVWAISDVPGDDLGSIGSGPCTGDPWTSDDVRRMLAKSRLLERLPEAVRAALAQETPKPDDATLVAISARIVASNRTALVAAAEMARQSGIFARVMDDPLAGEAATMGRRIAATMRDTAGSRPELLLWGGETTVTIAGPPGMGGRSQELALAAAQSLHATQTAGLLLAAGTDGRDGPTDAAGAMVNRQTWQRIAAAGRDPATDLSHHDGYLALDAAHALVRTGPTGTNVMDLVIAVTGVR